MQQTVSLPALIKYTCPASTCNCLNTLLVYAAAAAAPTSALTAACALLQLC